MTLSIRCCSRILIAQVEHRKGRIYREEEHYPEEVKRQSDSHQGGAGSSKSLIESEQDQNRADLSQDQHEIEVQESRQCVALALDELFRGQLLRIRYKGLTLQVGFLTGNNCIFHSQNAVHFDSA